jgi:hypothetical protein
MVLHNILLISGLVLMVSVVIAVEIFSRNFINTFKQKVSKLFSSQSIAEQSVVTEDDIIHLPEPVQRYLRYSGIIGTRRMAFVRLRQIGAMRPKPDGKWFPLRAEEYYTVGNPGFVWKGRMAIAPLISATAQDMYLNGQGNMHVKLMSAITMVNGKGKQMAEASLMRYFNEMQWFPSSLVSANVTWEAIDDNSACSTLTDRGMSVSATFYFDNEGKITNFVAERGRSTDDGQLVHTKWSTPISEYRTYGNGLRLPSKGEAIWHLDSGDYSYIKLEITDVEYDNPTLYSLLSHSDCFCSK